MIFKYHWGLGGVEVYAFDWGLPCHLALEEGLEGGVSVPAGSRGFWMRRWRPGGRCRKNRSFVHIVERWRGQLKILRWRAIVEVLKRMRGLF